MIMIKATEERMLCKLFLEASPQQPCTEPQSVPLKGAEPRTCWWLVLRRLDLRMFDSPKQLIYDNDALFVLQSSLVWINPVKFAITYTFGNLLSLGR